MQDIGIMLKKTSNENECSVFNALLILLKEKDAEEDKKDVYILQSKSDREPCRRLRY